MRHGTCEGPGTILGGLPVIAIIDHGKDDDTPIGPGEYWAQVRSIHWRRRDGSKGKEIPESVVHCAEQYDHGFCDLSDQVFEHIAYERWLAQAGEAGTAETVELGSVHEHAVGNAIAAILNDRGCKARAALAPHPKEAELAMDNNGLTLNSTEGWNEWSGGEAPVGPETEVLVRYRADPNGFDFERFRRFRAIDVLWQHYATAPETDIVAWKEAALAPPRHD